MPGEVNVDRFRTARIAHLATANTDGQPHVIPVTFAVTENDDAIYIAIDHKRKTTRDLRRLRDIRANPAVSLIVDHYDEDWTHLWWTRADGTARIIDNPADMASPIDLLVAKYPQYQRIRPEGPVIEINPSRWLNWTA
jgi:PPOX class probable F420-dependent enzyme